MARGDPSAEGATPGDYIDDEGLPVMATSLLCWLCVQYAPNAPHSCSQPSAAASNVDHIQCNQRYTLYDLALPFTRSFRPFCHFDGMQLIQLIDFKVLFIFIALRYLRACACRCAQ